MATTSKKELFNTIKSSNPGPDTRRRQGYTSAMSTLLDTVQTSTPSPIVNTVSGSGVVNLELVQPANTVLEDIIVLCTSATSHQTATIGFKAGTSVGGEQVVAAVMNAIAGSGTSTTVGQGTSIHSKVTTALQGGGAITLVAGAGYTSAERTIHCQVTASALGFNNDDGAFRAIGKYYNML
mgnify:CR=1 FL=1